MNKMNEIIVKKKRSKSKRKIHKLYSDITLNCEDESVIKNVCTMQLLVTIVHMQTKTKTLNVMLLLI